MNCNVRTAPLVRARPALVASRVPKGSSFAGKQLQLAMPRGEGYRKVSVMGLFGLGLPEIAVIAGVAALIFGPSKLPELGKGLGKTIKSFQGAAKEFEAELKAATADDDKKPGAGGSSDAGAAAPPKDSTKSQ